MYRLRLEYRGAFPTGHAPHPTQATVTLKPSRWKLLARSLGYREPETPSRTWEGRQLVLGIPIWRYELQLIRVPGRRRAD